VTPEIALVLVILAVAVVLFVSERLRMDLVALLVLCALALTGLVTAGEALMGFSNPAVVTVWAMFIISGGLSRTGVANIVGRQVLRVARQGEQRLVIVIMMTAALMSAFMNNVGVAAMLLPVVMDIARRTGRAPSRLLMPLAYGSLLGGLTTLIGTPPNILVSDSLRDYGLGPFQLFDFTPIGMSILVAGVLFVTFAGRHLLPNRDPEREMTARGSQNLRDQYELKERLFTIQLPPGAILQGKTLAASRLGSALQLNVVAIVREGQTQLAPPPGAVLQSEDRLLVQGRSEQVAELQGRQHLLIQEDALEARQLLSDEVPIVEMRLLPGSPLVGKTLYQNDWRRRFGVLVLAIRRHETLRRSNLQNIPLEAGDALLLQGPPERLQTLQDSVATGPFARLSEAELAGSYRLDERVVTLHVPGESILTGRTLEENRLGDAFGLTVLAIRRPGGNVHIMPEPGTRVEAEDDLLVKCSPEDLTIFRGLQELELEAETRDRVDDLESDNVGLFEVVLSPRTTVAGMSLRQLGFREKYGLSVLAIWREGQGYFQELRDMPLRFGDALLLYGAREKMKILGREPDFLVLTEAAQEPPLVEKAPIAVGILVAILAPVILGWIPISIAAVVGATLMVLTRCLTMEEAYRNIEWPAIFLIAGMLPLGIAMERTGAASLIATGVIGAIGDLGPRVVIAALFLLTSVATQIIPTAALVVLMAPIALNTAADTGLSPHALMMTVAMAASASFSSPLSHPANLMIMGPGGYRFVDYMKMGLPLTLVVLLVLLVVLPLFWPLVA
jgi:di/tricarboxylate transporter